MEGAQSASAAFDPHYLVIALGLDAIARDPFVYMSLETDDFARLGEMSRVAYSTVIIQESGSTTDELGANLTRFLDGLTG